MHALLSMHAQLNHQRSDKQLFEQIIVIVMSNVDLTVFIRMSSSWCNVRTVSRSPQLWGGVVIYSKIVLANFLVYKEIIL